MIDIWSKEVEISVHNFMKKVADSGKVINMKQIQNHVRFIASMTENCTKNYSGHQLHQSVNASVSEVSINKVDVGNDRWNH